MTELIYFIALAVIIILGLSFFLWIGHKLGVPEVFLFEIARRAKLSQTDRDELTNDERFELAKIVFDYTDEELEQFEEHGYALTNADAQPSGEHE